MAGFTKMLPTHLYALDDESMLDQLSDIAFQQMDANGNDLTQLDEPYRTVAIIYGAQGIIDNGGLCYFFENDWFNNPPYSTFADAYERIGRIEGAEAIRNAVASFGFDYPELDFTRRRAYMDSNYNEDTHKVNGWDDCICGDERVFPQLACWVRENYSPEAIAE